MENPHFSLINQHQSTKNMAMFNSKLSNYQRLPTWWLIPLSKWVITPVINGISRVNPFITGVITHLLTGMNHQVVLNQQLVSWMAQLVGPAAREKKARIGQKTGDPEDRGHPSKCVQRNNDRRQPLFMCIYVYIIYTCMHIMHIRKMKRHVCM